MDYRPHELNSYYEIENPRSCPFAPSILDWPRIHFSFLCYSIWESPLPRNFLTHFSHEYDDEIKYANVSVPLPRFRCYPKAYRFIKQKIQDLPIPEHFFENLIAHAYWEARKALESQVPSTDVYVQCRVNARHNIVLWPPTNGRISSMVPADDESIESLLESMKLTSSSRDCCSICLEEEVSELGDALMPCGHVFHRECITEWLRVNHVCPLCRFELPAAEAPCIV